MYLIENVEKSQFDALYFKVQWTPLFVTNLDQP